MDMILGDFSALDELVQFEEKWTTNYWEMKKKERAKE